MKKDIEQWKPMTDFPFLISSHGRLMLARQRTNRHKAGHFIKIRKTINRHGLTIRPNRTRTNKIMGHHFMDMNHSLLAFIVSKDSPVVAINHEDGNKANNKVSNLKYMTLSDNLQHASKMGLLTHGLVYSDKVVREIYKLGAKGVLPYTQIAVMFGVSYTTTRNIILGLHRKKTLRTIPGFVENPYCKPS